MSKKSFTPKTPVVLSFISLLVFMLVGESLYLSSNNSLSESSHIKKNSFVSLVGLPDLAITTEATYLRHRSMSDLFSIYKDDGVLREYFPSTFVYSHSHIINAK